MATDEHSTELCGERRPFAIAVPCGLAKDHGGDRHIPDPSKPNAGWWRTEPALVCGETFRGDLPPCGLPKGHGGLHLSPPVSTCSAVLHFGPRQFHECALPQGHTEHHKDSDGDEWDITWTRPQSARMDAPAVPLTFSRDRRLRALEEFQDAVTARLDALEKNRDHVRATLRSAGDRLSALENGSGRRINIHDFDRTMGRVTASLDAITPRLVGRGLDRPSEVVAKLDEILKRLGPPDVERCGSVRPYSGSHGRSGEPNPDDLCVKPEGHTDRHMNGTTTWPHLCDVKHPETGHPCWQLVGPNVQEHTAHRTVYGAVWESERTHDADCEREPEHGAECCAHPNGVGPKGCTGCGDHSDMAEPDDPKCVNGCQRANGHDGPCCGHPLGHATWADNRCASGCGDRLS